VYRPTTAYIDLQAIKHNFRLAQTLSGSGQCMAVIKDDAYGHGAVEVANVLEEMAPAYAVAYLEEAEKLRKANVRQPILIFSGVFDKDELERAAEQNYWVVVHTEEQVATLINSVIPKPVKVWLKMDSGMHRLGLPPQKLEAAYKQLQKSPNVQDEIIITTHLSSADDLESASTPRQLKVFNATVANLNAPVSIANSAALLAWESTRAQWNRPGYLLYGNSPFSVPHSEADQLKVAMTLKSRIIGLRDISAGESVGYGDRWTATVPARIATIAVGYSDGYPRHAKNGTPVIINGQRAPLVGTVSMDLISVDVTKLTGVAIGDAATLWGKGLSPNEVARYSGTIAYELLARLPQSTHRVYD
jgi:alanine racemase